MNYDTATGGGVGKGKGGGMNTGYCAVHEHETRGLCCDCVQGVPMAPAHTVEGQQAQRNAEREREWRAKRDALNSARKPVAGTQRRESGAGGKLSRLRGGWRTEREARRKAFTGWWEPLPRVLKLCAIGAALAVVARVVGRYVGVL